MNITNVLSKNKLHNQKKAMFYTVASSLILMGGLQTANAAICAPDVGYLIPKIKVFNTPAGIDWMKTSIKDDYLNNKEGACCSYGAIPYAEQIKIDNERFEEGLFSKEMLEDKVLINKERIKQLDCMRNGGQFAASSENFDVNGNYKGSSQQASNKKTKSGKANSQEQVASAISNENNTNNTDSNNTESSDAKSKGKEFAKDEKRLHANSCVSVRREKDKVPAFKNICPYPIEVVWCANSKEDPNQCDRGWNGQWNFGVGHSEPINATSATHWVVAACKGENSLYMNEELKRNKRIKCVKWDK